MTVSVIVQLILEMYMLRLIEDCIISCYIITVRRVITARALTFRVAALHFVKCSRRSDKCNKGKLNCREHKRC